MTIPMDRLNSQMNMTEEIASNFEDRLIGNTHLLSREKKYKPSGT